MTSTNARYWVMDVVCVCGEAHQFFSEKETHTCKCGRSVRIEIDGTQSRPWVDTNGIDTPTQYGAPQNKGWNLIDWEDTPAGKAHP